MEAARERSEHRRQDYSGCKAPGAARQGKVEDNREGGILRRLCPECPIAHDGCIAGTGLPRAGIDDGLANPLVLHAEAGALQTLESSTPRNCHGLTLTACPMALS